MLRNVALSKTEHGLQVTHTLLTFPQDGQYRDSCWVSEGTKYIGRLLVDLMDLSTGRHYIQFLEYESKQQRTSQ